MVPKKIPYLGQKESSSDIESKDYMSIKTISYQRMQIILEEHMKKKITIQQLQKNLRLFNGNKEWICQTDQGRSHISFPEKILQDGCNWHPIIFILNNLKEIYRFICLGKGNGLTKPVWCRSDGKAKENLSKNIKILLSKNNDSKNYMNKQMEMGKTMFEVMKMRKNNKQNPFPLRKYYGAMIIGCVFFLGIMAYYSATFRQRRDQAKQEVSLEEESIGANNSATQEKTKTTTQDKKETETTAQMKRTMSESVTYNGTSKLTWPIKGNIILPYSVNSTIYFESLDQYRINKGILIEAKEGDEVKAVRKAKVREIKKSAEYGQTVLMDLGNEYTVLYGQLKDIRVKEGTMVNAGEVIAKVAEPTSYYTLEGTNLYFQMEKDKKSVDPLKYLE